MGFTLIYRRDGSEWEEVSLSRKLNSYEVSNLSCGRVYEFFLTGMSKSSKEVNLLHLTATF